MTVAARKQQRRRIANIETRCNGGCQGFEKHRLYRVLDPSDMHHVLVCSVCKRERRLEVEKGAVKLSYEDVVAQYAGDLQAAEDPPEPEDDDDEC